MSMFRRRLMMQAQNSGDYVQDGLILDLRGADAPANGLWVSRVNGYTFDVSAISHEGNLYRITTQGICSNKAINYNSNALTIELVEDGTLLKNSSLAIFLESSANANYNSDTFIFDFSENNPYYFLIGGMGNFSEWSSSEFAPSQSAKQYCVNINDDNTFSAFVNSSEVNLSIIKSNKKDENNYTSQVLYVGARNINSYVTKMGIYALRIYNRKLTDSERLNNYKIDKATYKI